MQLFLTTLYAERLAGRPATPDRLHPVGPRPADRAGTDEPRPVTAR